MAVSASVQEFLRQSHVGYAVFPHAPAYTAQEEAAVTHVPGRAWAKPVVCFADREPIMAVVAADRLVNLEKLLELAGAGTIRLADEWELSYLYPDCERGAMPPFGPLFNQRVFVDDELEDQDEIVFNAGSHADAICMRYDDFVRITRPLVGSFAERQMR
jgi:Ala-tRNA(Pro) deacylase